MCFMCFGCMRMVGMFNIVSLDAFDAIWRAWILHVPEMKPCCVCVSKMSKHRRLDFFVGWARALSFLSQQNAPTLAHVRPPAYTHSHTNMTKWSVFLIQLRLSVDVKHKIHIIPNQLGSLEFSISVFCVVFFLVSLVLPFSSRFFFLHRIRHRFHSIRMHIFAGALSALKYSFFLLLLGPCTR